MNKSVLIKWENRFGKHRKITTPYRAEKLAKEFAAKGWSSKIVDIFKK